MRRFTIPWWGYLLAFICGALAVFLFSYKQLFSTFHFTSNIPSTYRKWFPIIARNSPELCKDLTTSGIPENYLLKQYTIQGGTVSLILCQRFAYQESFRVVFTDTKGKQTFLRFREYTDKDMYVDVDAPVDVQFDKKSGIFTIFTKERGTADCGTIGTYQMNTRTKSADILSFSRKICDSQTGWEELYSK